MSQQPSPEDLAREIQGLPLTGYQDPYMRTLVLRVTEDARAARRFLQELLRKGWLDFGGRRTQRPHASGINIGFTHEGLRLLGAPPGILRALKNRSAAFADGAELRAARYLGDAGRSAAERWSPVFRRAEAHVWIALHDKTQAAVQSAVDDLCALPGATAGLEGWGRAGGVPDAEHLLDPRDRRIRSVHFGFRDNITKPSILDKRGNIPEPAADGKPVRPRPGELLLGYPNNAGADVWTADPTPRELAAFLRNGSFGVLRQIEQDPAAFEDYLREQAALLRQRGHGAVTPAYLKAKLCGRWPNGAPVRPEQWTQPPDWQPDAAADRRFDDDPKGLGCPFGAHIRRANPRDDPLLPPVDRTLFRRSVPYGPRFKGAPDGIERGLVGVFFCARVEDQFELLVSEWLEKNPLGPPNAGRAKDPLSGRHDEPDAEFHIPQPHGDPFVLRDLRPFTRTRGTLYALFPSRHALESIARGEYGALA